MSLDSTKHTIDSIQDWGSKLTKNKNTSHQETQPHNQKMQKRPTQNISTAQMQKDPRQTSKARERKCSSTEQTRIDKKQTSCRPNHNRKESHTGKWNSEPQARHMYHTYITHISHKAFSFLPPPFCLIKGLPAVMRRGQKLCPSLPLVHEFTTNSVHFCVPGTCDCDCVYLFVLWLIL